MVYLLIGIGGFIGSVARYATSNYLTKVFPGLFPYGTFLVNMSGCLIIGLVYGFSEKYEWSTPEWRLFLATGICGGYTTFSAFAFENVKLLQDGNYLIALTYIVASVLLSVLAAWAGFMVPKVF